MQITAITLTQPWASLVALGYKSFETRSYGTSYRGLLAIHAAKGFGEASIAICRQDPFRRLLISAGLTTPSLIPLGCVVAVVTLKDIFPVDVIAPSLPLLERSLGDYTSGRHAWLLTDILQLKTPISAKGALNLWDWDAPFDEEQLAAQGKAPW